MSLPSEARKLLDKRKADEEASKKHKETKERLEAQQRIVHDLLEAQEMPTVTLDLGPGYGRVQLGKRSTIFGRVIDIDTAIAALEKEGYGEEMVKSELRKGALNEMIRTRLENGEPLPDGVDFSETRYVQVTRRKKK